MKFMKKIISTFFVLGISLAANMLSAQELSTPQMKAIYTDNIDVFKKQFAKADYNKCFVLKTDAFSPLGFSAMYGKNEIVKYLLDNKADINKPCNEKTPLDLAELGERKETAKLLLEKGAVRN
jgi:hypothetical protein